jgi:hypothetical protein
MHQTRIDSLNRLSRLFRGATILIGFMLLSIVLLLLWQRDHQTPLAGSYSMLLAAQQQATSSPSPTAAPVSVRAITPSPKPAVIIEKFTAPQASNLLAAPPTAGVPPKQEVALDTPVAPSLTVKITLPDPVEPGANLTPAIIQVMPRVGATRAAGQETTPGNGTTQPALALAPPAISIMQQSTPAALLLEPTPTPIILLLAEAATPSTDPLAAANQEAPEPAPTPTLSGSGLPYTVDVAVRYAEPAEAAAELGRLDANQIVSLLGRHTSGLWYLLADGSWILATSVANAPALLPLVFPTPTPTPTITPPPTPTGTPEPPTPAPPTLTPTPTSLDEVVCSCEPDQYACLSHYFPTRGGAQACYEYCFRVTGQDIHKLDLDRNGLACEALQP